MVYIDQAIRQFWKELASITAYFFLRHPLDIDCLGKELGS